MPASDEGGFLVSDDLISWQRQAQNDPLSELGNRACAELTQLGAALDEVNDLLYADPEAFSEDAAIAAMIKVARLSMRAAIHILGMTARSSGGLTVKSVVVPPLSTN